jgi:hypothetical protein
MTKSFPRWPLFASLFAYFALTTALIIAVPPAAAPDEAAHWLYVEHLATLGNLPVFSGGAPAVNPGYEFHQPPLYYLICAPLWKALGAGAQNYACRVVSMLCGLATIWVIWGAARLVLPSNWRVAAVAAGFSALLPLHQAIGTGASNDGLSGLVCALLFYLVARLWTYGPTWRDVWQLGLVAGLGIATKNTTLAVAAACFTTLFFLPSRRVREGAPRGIPAFAVAVGIALLIGGPVLLRNQTLYGDVLAQGIFKTAFRAASPGPAFFAQYGIDSLDYAQRLFFVAFCTTWGFYGGPNTVISATRLFSRSPLLPTPDLLAAMAFCFVAPLLALLGLHKMRIEEELSEIPKRVRQAWSLGIVFVFIAWAQFAAQYFAGAQARYGHAALLPISIFLAAGWVGFWGRGRALTVASSVFGLILVCLTLLNVFVWKTLV